MDSVSALEKARTIHRQGQIEQAASVYREILENEPENADALHLLGVAHLQKGDAKVAAELIGKSAAAKPTDARIQNNLGSALVALGSVEDAAQRFARASELDPDFADAAYNLGNVLRDLDRASESEAAYRRALAIDPGHTAAHNNLGSILLVLGRLDESLEHFRAAYDLEPESGEFHANLLKVLELTNRLDEAEELSREIPPAGREHPIARVIRARIARRTGQLDEAYEFINAVHSERHEPAVRYAALCELSTLLDRRGDFSGAFTACTQAKTIRLAMSDAKSWEIEAYRRTVQRHRDWIEGQRISAQPQPPGENIPPVFFVGFPRSGTTLMEQILGAHPQLVTTGERSPLWKTVGKSETVIGRKLVLPDGIMDLSTREIAAIRTQFAEHLREMVGGDPSDLTLVDKLPLNIVHLALINRLFPEGRAIVAIRDPRDVCLSAYMQQFQHNTAMQSFMTLDSTGKTYAAVMDLWLAYRERISLPFLEYRYEDLVGDFDATVRRVLDFIGVGWSESVLDYAVRARERGVSTPSYTTVIQPITKTAVGRWRHYREQLEPILPILEPFVREFGYEPS